MTEDTEGLFDLFGGGAPSTPSPELSKKIKDLEKQIKQLKASDTQQTKKLEKVSQLEKTVDDLKKAVQSAQQGGGNVSIPKLVHTQKSVQVEGGTVRVPLPSGVKNPLVIAFAEEEKIVKMSLPKVKVNPLDPIGTVRLKRISVNIQKSRMSLSGVPSLQGAKIDARVLIGPIINGASKIPKVHLPTINVNQIQNKLGFQDMLKKTEDMQKKGMGMLKVNVPQLKKIDKMPTISGLSFPRVLYAVYDPHYTKCVTGPGQSHCSNVWVLDYSDPHFGMIIPLFEPKDISKLPEGQREGAMQKWANKHLPKKAGRKWQICPDSLSIKNMANNIYGVSLTTWTLHGLGHWTIYQSRAFTIWADAIKIPLGKLIGKVQEGIVSAGGEIISKAMDTIKGGIDTLNTYVVGKPATKSNEKMAISIYRPDIWIQKTSAHPAKTYVQGLRDKVAEYKKHPTPAKAQVVRQYLQRLISYPPTKQTVRVGYTGGVNAALEAVKIMLNDSIDTINAISEALPIVLFGGVKASVDGLVKPAYKYISDLTKGVNSTITTFVDQYNSKAKTLNNSSDKMHQNLIKTLLETAKSVGNLTKKYNSALNSLDKRLRDIVKDANNALAYASSRIQKTVDDTNSAISSTESIINTKIVPKINSTISNINTTVKTINSTPEKTITTKTVRPLTPSIGTDSFTVQMGKGTLHYTVFGFSL